MRETTVLLVDDNPDDIALAKRVFERRNPRTRLEVATSGRAALDLLNHGDLPTAIFLDINMPGWNGFDVLRRVRAQERTRNVPVVMLTTSSEPADVAKSYELGANSYVPKPLDFDEFTEIFAAMTHYWAAVNEVI